MSDKRKQGEKEVMQILKSKGITFIEDYSDDGQKGYSIPDLQYSDGRYLEVTHTLHNNELAKPVSRQYSKQPLEEQYKIAKAAGEARERMQRLNYPFETESATRLTREGAEQFARDRRIVDSYFGKYDERTGRRSEFKCDMPIVEFSSDNILREVREKGEKYQNGDTDLFIFVDREEYESMLYLIETRNYNGNYHHFMQSIFKSPFKTIFVCVWLFEEQRYIIENPTIMKFWKADEGTLQFAVMT